MRRERQAMPTWMQRAHRAALSHGSFGRPLAVKREGKVARLEIFDFIGYDPYSDSGVSAADVAAQLRDAEGVDELHVHVNSPGGDVFEGVAIYNQIRRFNAKKTTYVEGVAASIASVIALAADHVVTGHGAMWMVHAPWSFVMMAGNANEIEAASSDLVASLRKIGDVSADIYADQTGAPRAKVLEWMSKDTWFSGAEALEHGFTDEVEAPPAAEPEEPEVEKPAARALTPAEVQGQIDGARRVAAKLRSSGASPGNNPASRAT